MPDIKTKNNKLTNLKITINEYKKDINEVILKLNNLMDNLDIYFSINNYIINNFQKRNRNFSMLQNLNYINSNIDEFIKDINNIKNNFKII